MTTKIPNRKIGRKGYTLPEYCFVIETLNGKHKSDKSGILKTQDYIAIKMDGAANEKYEVYNIKGEQVNPSTRGVSINMASWWDGDLSRELLDGVRIS